MKLDICYDVNTTKNFVRKNSRFSVGPNSTWVQGISLRNDTLQW